MMQALNTENARESIRSSLMNRKIMARLVEISQGEESASPAATDATDTSPESEPEEESQEETSPAEEAKE
jgi:hypothetical protein